MAVRPGYKQTEVGVIPNHWEIKASEELCVKIQDGTHFSPTVGGFDYLYVTSKNIGRGILDVSNAERIDTAQHKKIYARCDVKRGDLLLTKDGVNTGNAAINHLDEEFSLLSSVALLRFIPKLYEPAFYMQYILSGIGQARIKELMSGNAITRLTLDKIRKFRFPVPPFAEQQAIAEALSDVDGLISALDALIAKKRAIKGGAMQELLCPKDAWVPKKLGDLAYIQRGASPRPIDNPIWFDNNSAIGWVRISDVTRSDMYLRETTQRLSKLGVQNSRPVLRGSLIMSICATVGRPIITEIEACIHDGFVVFDNLQADKLFMYYVLKYIESEWSKHGQTGSQMNLNTDLINQTEIALPPLPEQTAIAQILADMDAEIAALVQKREKTVALKQGMMQELLTGKMRLV